MELKIHENVKDNDLTPIIVTVCLLEKKENVQIWYSIFFEQAVMLNAKFQFLKQ